MKNFAGRGGFYPPKPKAEVDKPFEICRTYSQPFRSLLITQPRPQVFSVNGSKILTSMV